MKPGGHWWGPRASSLKAVVDKKEKTNGFPYSNLSTGPRYGFGPAWMESDLQDHGSPGRILLDGEVYKCSSKLSLVLRGPPEFP